MSMAVCDNCTAYIDTDEQLECYRDAAWPHKLWTEWRNDNVCWCETCLEQLVPEEGLE